MELFLNGIGLCGPGFPNWMLARQMLGGSRPYHPEEIPDPRPEFLPPNECRRSSAVVRWSLQVAHEALVQAQVKPQDVLTVFATSGGETAILHAICEALAKPDRPVSPTLFHQSVHNAAAGYWSIATSSSRPSVSLSCYDTSLSAGLMETVALIGAYQECPVLLVVYDHAPPPPLYQARPLVAPFAVAFLIAPSQNPQSQAGLTVELGTEKPVAETLMVESHFETLRKGNPAARALPILSAVAGRSHATVTLGYMDDCQVTVTIRPCLS